MSGLDRLLFCAPSSGGGKTTIVCGILQALVNRKLKPVAFKCGPDYIDPMFHSEVIGARSRNLDLFFMDEKTVRYLLAENGKTGGISIIEGVMGYYDGIAMSDRASAYHLATATQTPAVLVVDVRGKALSTIALIKGFLEFRSDSAIRGIILNRVSPMFYPRLKQAIEEKCGVRVYGFLPECPEASLESRHLGLVTAAEIDNLRDKLYVLADLCQAHIEIDALLELAGSAPQLEVEPPKLPKPLENQVKIAVAKDKAFCFYYEDSLSLLHRLGAQTVCFSPLEDEKLPEGCCGLYLGGGYPELYAQMLSQNTKMLGSIRSAIDGGMPTIAECGGFMYLHETMQGEDGKDYPMAGVINARAYRTPRLSRFGYVTLEAKTDGLLGKAGTTIPAHEFHYWDSTAPGDAFAAQKPQSERGWSCAYTSASMYAGFPHFHFWAVPKSAKSFLKACDEYRSENYGA